MKLAQILKNIKYELINLIGDEEIMHITVSAEKCDKKTLLIIPNSKKADLKDIEECSAAAIICDSELSLASHMPKVLVDNPRSALSHAYSDFYAPDYESMKIIGITGTNGKTSTAAFIEAALKRGGYKVGVIGTGIISIDGESVNEENYSMTTPDPPLLYKTLKQMELSGCEYVVMEVSSHALALSKVEPIRFEYGVMTNLAAEHLDFHADIEEYYRAKTRLFPLCKTVIFNIDDCHCRRAYNEFSGRKLSTGVLFPADTYADNIKDLGFDGVEYLYHGRNFTFFAKLKTAGIYNIYNSMLAIALATDTGIAPCKAKEAVFGISVIEGRYEIIKDDITVIIDYAHTDSALECILKSIFGAKGRSELTVIFGAGGERDRQKRPRMARAAEKYADKIIVTTDNSRGEEPMKIIADIIKGFKNKSYEIHIDRAEAIRSAIISARSGATVAIIGKGRERYNIDKIGYHPFDERKIVAQALTERKKHENKT